MVLAGNILLKSLRFIIRSIIVRVILPGKLRVGVIRSIIFIMANKLGSVVPFQRATLEWQYGTGGNKFLCLDGGPSTT